MNNMTMKPTETVDAYQKRLMNKIQTLELTGGAELFCLDLKNVVGNESEMSDYTENELNSDDYGTPDKGETAQEKTLIWDKKSRCKLHKQNRDQRKKNRKPTKRNAWR